MERFGTSKGPGMLANLDFGWLLMAVGTVSVIAFMFGNALDAIMREDGFGPFGNMFLFLGGFFGAIFVANEFGINLGELKLAIAYGLGGAFALIAVLALIKAAIARYA